MHSWISVSGSLSVSPVRMLRVQPEVFTWVHEKQMPMRQPYSGLSPAASACSSNVAPRVVDLGVAGGEAHGAGRVAGDGCDLRRELLDVQSLEQPGLLVVLTDGAHQSGRPAHESVGVHVPRCGRVQMVGAEEAGQVAVVVRGVGEDEAHVVVLGSDALEFGAVRDVRRIVCIVQEHDLAAMTLVAQRAKHRQDGRDAATPADEQRPCGTGVRQHERAVGLSEIQHEARTRIRMQPPREQPVGVRLDGELEPPVRPQLRTARRVAPRAAHAVDHGRDLDELAGAESTPLPCRFERERESVGRRTDYLRHLGPQFADGEHRIDQFEVPVDAVRRRESLEQFQR